ncbi:exopolysaccharide biosynthesis protein [Wenzhouxiangella psychrophila]|uniref:exopolysaccharide biosynthesis protein n=1 Tax=Wenzhouxiangella sp. EGI_FJ10305 TaxID=3243768 RepID=UPI0035E37DBD
MESEIRSLEQLLDRIRKVDPIHDPVHLDAILQAIGRRSFGPIILLTGLITLAPLIGDIPGIPTLMALLVLLTAGQLLLGRKTFWLPGFLLQRSVQRARLHRALDHLEKPVRFIDRFLHPRLEVITRGHGTLVIATACICIALTMPALEFIPFSANLAGAALTAFGLSLIARDGYLAVFALTITVGTFWVVIANLSRIGVG